MKKTKCLFPEGTSTCGMVSVSQLQTFMSCPKKWAYNYIENLTPRVERPYLSIGKLCHKGMEAAMRYKWEYQYQHVGYMTKGALAAALAAIESEWQEYMNNNCFLSEEIPAQEQILTDAKNVLSRRSGSLTSTDTRW